MKESCARLSNRRHAACVMLQIWSRSYLARQQLNASLVDNVESRNDEPINCVASELYSTLHCQTNIHEEDRRCTSSQRAYGNTLHSYTVSNSCLKRIERSAVTILQERYKLVYAHRLFQTRRSHCTKDSIICTSMSGEEQRSCQRTTEEER